MYASFGRLFLLVLSLLFAIPNINSANILAIIPFPSLSHSIPFVPLFQSLSTQHNVTVITSNPTAIHPSSNVKTIDVSEVYHRDLSTELIETLTGYNIGKHHQVFRAVVQNPDVRSLILDENGTFDLVLTDATSPIWSVFGHRYDCPVVGLLPYDVYMVHMKLGTPTNPAVHSDRTTGLNYNMNTFEKIYNILIGILLISNDFFYTQQKLDYYLNAYFPKVPGFEVNSNLHLSMDMLFINEIPGFHKLRATYENTKYIGSGQKYVETYSALVDYGGMIGNNSIIVVYVEFADDDLPIRLLDEFQKIGRTIFWVKHPKLGPHKSQNNIKLIEPYEFQDILQNYPVDLLVSNGDNHHIEISLLYAIPMLVISHENEGQEMQNVQKLKQHNIVQVLHIDKIETLQVYVDDLIKQNKEYRQLIINYSMTMRTPLSGLRTATIWLEWLLENRKSLHLEGIRSPTLNMNFDESWYLDIAIALLVTILIGLAILLFLGTKSIEFITRTAASKELVY